MLTIKDMKSWISLNIDLEKQHYKNKKSYKKFLQDIKDKNNEKLKRYEKLNKILKEINLHKESHEYHFENKNEIFNTFLKNMVIHYTENQSFKKHIDNLFLFSYDKSSLFERATNNKIIVPVGNNKNQFDHMPCFLKENQANDKNVVQKEVEQIQNLINSNNQQEYSKEELEYINILMNNVPTSLSLFEEIKNEKININFLYDEKNNLDPDLLSFPNIIELYKNFQKLFNIQIMLIDEIWGKKEYHWLNETNEKYDTDNMDKIVPYCQINLLPVYHDVMSKNPMFNINEFNLNNLAFEITNNGLSEYHEWILPIIKNNYESLESECLICWNKEDIETFLNYLFINNLPFVKDSEIGVQYQFLNNEHNQLTELYKMIKIISHETANQLFTDNNKIIFI